MGRDVLLVDDDAEFRAVARQLLEEAGFVVVGEASDGASALITAQSLNPSIVLLDVQLPDIDGFEVCRQLASTNNHAEVVLVSSRQRSAYRRRLDESAAVGFLAKDELSGTALVAVLGEL
jgi:DNA-binding NarL/FixJ family response regulator